LSLAEANVVTGCLGPDDSKSRSCRSGLVVTSLPAMLVIALGTDSYVTPIVNQVILSVHLPFTILPSIARPQPPGDGR